MVQCVWDSRQVRFGDCQEDNFTKDFLDTLFREYEKHGIGYCILRDYENLTERITSNDIDMIISRDDMPDNMSILDKIVMSFGMTRYYEYDTGGVAQVYLYRKLTDECLVFIRLDFHTDTRLFGIRLISGEEILAKKIRYKSFFVASPVYAFLDKWVYNYTLGCRTCRKCLKLFGRIESQDQEELERVLCRVFPQKVGRRLYQAMVEGTLSALPPITPSVRYGTLFKSFLNGLSASALDLAVFFLKKSRYKCFPGGEWVSLSGPDGCGKTTVMDLAYSYLRYAFPVSEEGIFHSRPSLFPRIADVAHKIKAIPTVDEDYHIPYRAKPSKFLGSIARTGYYLLDYIFGYFLKVRPLLVRRELVIFDRYYHDMVADPERSNICLPFTLLNIFLRFVPKPNSSFFIFANSDTIRKRKNELVKDRIEILNGRYTKFAEQDRNFVQIPNEHDPNITAVAIVDSIIQRRAKRLTVRHQ